MHPIRTVLASLALASCLVAQDWTNAGGNSRRNGQTEAYGPLTAEVAWSGSSSSVIAWQPVIAGDRVFVVRQLGFPPAGEPDGSPVVCHDLQSGVVLWSVDIPFQDGEWTTWVAGTSDGKVYACRSGNGATSSAKIYALDQATGAVVWMSQDLVDASPYDGVVFAPNGDLIVGSFTDLWRIRATDGTTAWNTARSCSVTSSCGVCLHDGAIYAANTAPGGHVIEKYDLATGVFEYQGPLMPGFLVQNTPMAGPDGTIYFNRVQNNPVTDYFYAFEDTGSALVLKWSIPSQWGTSCEFAVGFNGNVYMLQPGGFLSALDSETGAPVATYLTPLSDTDVRMAVDADDRLYVSNGGFANGEVYSFDPDLTLRWSVPVTNVNIGAPAIGNDGTLVVAGVGSNLTAYRTPSPFTTLAGGVPGINGQSIITGDGTLTGDNEIHIGIENARPDSIGVLLIGFTQLNFPLFGGTIVPSPDLVASGIPLDTDGRAELPLLWPEPFGPGVNVWFQWWYADLAAVEGLGASHGLFGLAP